MRTEAKLWFWGLWDIIILAVALTISVVSWAKLNFIIPAALTLIYGFLSMRLDECSVLDYVKRAARFFLTTQQYYEWKEGLTENIEQLRLVQSFDWFDLSKLDDVEDIIRGVLSEDADETYIDENRINAVANAVRRRLHNLEQIIREHQTESFSKSSISTEDDVEGNVAEDYSPKMEL